MGIQNATVRRLAVPDITTTVLTMTLTGIAADYLPLNGYEIERGRVFSSEDISKASAVCILGAQAASVFFPTGDAVGQVIRVSLETVKTVTGLPERYAP